MQNITIAFLSYDQITGFPADDEPVVAELSRRGITARAVPWKSTEVDWRDFQGVVVRSCWDYHLDPEAFSVWMDHVDQMSIPVFNSTSIIRWNLHKRYLEELGRRGIAVPQTRYIDRGSRIDLVDLMDEMNWQKAVVKPCISASGYKTFVINASTARAQTDTVNEFLQTNDFLIQEYVDEVVRDGEMSLVYFDRKYSHCVLKEARPGDFRVQEIYGGKTKTHIPGKEILDFGEDILRLVDGDLLYARVDCVLRNGEPCLMELELIEPVLFFGHDAASGGRFADAVSRLVSA